MDNMFELASRLKVRFPFKGLISVEDLWDLSVESLDAIFKVLNSQVKLTKEESLLDARTKQEEELTLKVEIIKHVVKTKVEENNARLRAKELKEKKQKILGIMADKQDAELQNKSVEELAKMLDELS